jgi:hypothetical protein
VYRIKAGQRIAARTLGVVIRPSTSPGKKIDVYKHGFKIASIGAEGYQDFWGYVALEKPAKSLKERQRSAAASIRFGMPLNAPAPVRPDFTPAKFFGKNGTQTELF